MQILIGIGAVIIGYILGSIPFGLIIVKLKTGKDIRTVESGRTGGTNAVRAAGLAAGLLTAILDILKGAVAVWVARALSPGMILSTCWLQWQRSLDITIPPF
jgi:glycerol-3-phosphate acyltransferase PlsY